MNSPRAKAFGLNLSDGNRSLSSFYKFFASLYGKDIITRHWRHREEPEILSLSSEVGSPVGRRPCRGVFDNLSAENSNRRPEEAAKR